jgi:hypothetical protein
MDQSGLARRLVIGFLVAIAAGSAAYAIATSLTSGSHDNPYNWKGGGPTQFVWYVTGFVAFGAGIVTFGFLNARAKKKWFAQLTPQARVVKTDDDSRR